MDRGDWCILRTSGSSTLRLSRMLAAGGFDVWTPVEIQTRRDRRTGERHERIVAVMPTYVFARAEHLGSLAELSVVPVSAYPAFSVFRHYDKFPLITDQELGHLKAIEKESAAKAKPVVFNRGDEVRADIAGFQGLTGQVAETSHGKYTLVAFPNFHIPVKFASWQLNPVDVNGEATKAAKAA